MSYEEKERALAAAKVALEQAEEELLKAAGPEIDRGLSAAMTNLGEVLAIVRALPDFPSLDRSEAKRSLRKDLEAMSREILALSERTKKL